VQNTASAVFVVRVDGNAAAIHDAGGAWTAGSVRACGACDARGIDEQMSGGLAVVVEERRRRELVSGGPGLSTRTPLRGGGASLPPCRVVVIAGKRREAVSIRYPAGRVRTTGVAAAGLHNR
jgi:hypothetical protein